MRPLKLSRKVLSFPVQSGVKGRRSRPRRQLNSRYIPVQICKGCAKLGALLFSPAFVTPNFPHRSFDACEIFALAAAEITRVFPPVVLALPYRLRASVASSRLNAANMSMNPLGTQTFTLPRKTG
jgi:hypothetical protein